mgnify:FL=1
MINSRKNEISQNEIKKLLKIIDNNKDKRSKYETIFFLLYIFLKKTNHKNTYLKKKILLNLSKKTILKLDIKKILDEINIGSIGYIIDFLFQEQLSITKINDINQRKLSGSYYTPFFIAESITKKTLVAKKNIKILDPCCGTGTFLSAVCKFLYSKKFSKEEIINSIYAFDINNDALIIAKFIICAELKLSEELTKKFLNNNNFINIDSLLMDYPDQNLFSEKSLDIKFDYIVTNPPYERLKPDGYSVEGKNDIENYIKKIKSKRYDLSLSGNLNLYKLFLEKILRIIEYSNGKAGLIIPSTFTNDLSCSKIRKFIIKNNIINEIILLPESAKTFVGVNQAFAILILDFRYKNKNKKIGKIKKRTDLLRVNFDEVNLSFIEQLFPKELNIPILSTNEMKLFKHLKKFPILKDNKAIINKRGEVDLTVYKKFITIGEKKLIKGKNIEEYSLKNDFEKINIKGFYEKSKSNNKFIDHRRLACQQISNIDSKKRLKFAEIKPGFLLGNSLNFLAFNNENKDYFFGIYAICNSILLDWFFKVTSSNNHINNYQIDLFPIPTNKKKIERLGKFLREVYFKKDNPKNRHLLEHNILEIYECLEYKEILIANHPKGHELLNA